MKRIIIFFSILSLCIAFSVHAQEAEIQATENAPIVSLDSEGLVSLDFRDANIHNVLEVLALKSGVNIVSSPEVTGTVSIQLNKVPWKQALNVILQTYGYAFEQQGNIIVVTTIEDLKLRRENAQLLAEQESLSTEIFTLNFATAEKVVSSIEKIKSDRGKIDFDERTNTIIVTDVQQRLEVIEGVVKKLDKTTPQVLIEGKIIETVMNDDESLGIDWNVSANTSGAARGTTYPFRTTSGNTYAPGSLTASTLAAGSAADIPANFNYTAGVLDFTGVNATLNMLKTRTGTNILSNPRIVTLDNQPAVIKVATEYPIPSYSYSTDTNQLKIDGFDWIDLGVVFKVTPHVNSKDFVTLDVEPSVSEQAGTVTFENDELPKISRETTKTTVLIKNGNTLVISGLIKTFQRDVETKVPVLGDIPLLGKLFRHNVKDDDKTDLVIFITPHIITPEMPDES